MDSGKRKNQKLNNRGSAIITVIVVVAFIGILATIILYAAGMNYIMKRNDYKVKKSFYTAETAMEEIKAVLAQEVSYASGAAYNRTMIKYAEESAPVREYSYKSDFLNTLKQNWDKRLTPSAGVTLTYQQVMQGIIDDRYNALYPGVTEIPQVTCAGGIQLEGDHARIADVGIIYTDEDGFTTEIQTDFWIFIPDIDWSVDASRSSYADGEGASAIERETVEMVDCVQYRNWVKK